jgi:hypothetical protein
MASKVAPRAYETLDGSGQHEQIGAAVGRVIRHDLVGRNRNPVHQFRGGRIIGPAIGRAHRAIGADLNEALFKNQVHPAQLTPYALRLMVAYLPLRLNAAQTQRPTPSSSAAGSIYAAPRRISSGRPQICRPAGRRLHLAQGFHPCCFVLTRHRDAV